jgi:lysophospholipase L1-like esterase
VGILEKRAGRQFRIIKDGLCGRTVMTDDAAVAGVNRNAARTFKTALVSHAPLYACFIMLGTNDLKPQFANAPAAVADGCLDLALLALDDFGYGPPPRKVFLVCPPSLTEFARPLGFPDGPEKSAALKIAVRQKFLERRAPGLELVFADDHIKNNSLDGVHLSREDHASLGMALAAFLRKI